MKWRLAFEELQLQLVYRGNTTNEVFWKYSMEGQSGQGSLESQRDPSWQGAAEPPAYATQTSTSSFLAKFPCYCSNTKRTIFKFLKFLVTNTRILEILKRSSRQRKGTSPFSSIESTRSIKKLLGFSPPSHPTRQGEPEGSLVGRGAAEPPAYATQTSTSSFLAKFPCYCVTVQYSISAPG